MSVAVDGKPFLSADVVGKAGHWRFADFCDRDGHRLTTVLADLAKSGRACPKD